MSDKKNVISRYNPTPKMPPADQQKEHIQERKFGFKTLKKKFESLIEREVKAESKPSPHIKKSVKKADSTGVKTFPPEIGFQSQQSTTMVIKNLPSKTEATVTQLPQQSGTVVIKDGVIHESATPEPSEKNIGTMAEVKPVKVESDRAKLTKLATDTIKEVKEKMLSTDQKLFRGFIVTDRTLIRDLVDTALAQPSAENIDKLINETNIGELFKEIILTSFTNHKRQLTKDYREELETELENLKSTMLKIYGSNPNFEALWQGYAHKQEESLQKLIVEANQSESKGGQFDINPIIKFVNNFKLQGANGFESIIHNKDETLIKKWEQKYADIEASKAVSDAYKQTLADALNNIEPQIKEKFKGLEQLDRLIETYKSIKINEMESQLYILTQTEDPNATPEKKAVTHKEKEAAKEMLTKLPTSLSVEDFEKEVLTTDMGRDIPRPPKTPKQ